jgi:hypothetical protein
MSQTARPTPRPHAKPVRSRGGTRRSQPPEQPQRPCVICPDLDPALACDTCIANACERRERGYDVAEIARVMQIDTDHVWLLLAAPEAIAELEALKVDTVPTEGLRALIRAACFAPDSDFGVRDDVEHIKHGRMSDANLDDLVARLRTRPRTTLTAVCLTLGHEQLSWLSRKVGAIPKAGQAGQPRTYNETIAVHEASEIVRALGILPAEVDWL